MHLTRYVPDEPEQAGAEPLFSRLAGVSGDSLETRAEGGVWCARSPQHEKRERFRRRAVITAHFLHRRGSAMPDSRDRRAKPQPKDEPETQVKTGPSADDAHEVQYFRRHLDDNPDEHVSVLGQEHVDKAVGDLVGALETAAKAVVIAVRIDGLGAEGIDDDLLRGG
jgi:hypothetical protein